MKQKEAIFITISVALLLILPSISNNNSQSMVSESHIISEVIQWSDDFSDGDYDGWTIMEGTLIPPYSPRYSMQAGTSHSMNMISHSSDQIIGTWFFEIYEDSHFESGVEILFMVNGTNTENFKGYSMSISCTPEYHRLWFVRWDYSDHVGYTTRWLLAYQDIWTSDQPHYSGWRSYNITRTDEGMVYILRNDLLILTCNPAVVEGEFDVLLTHSDKFIARIHSGRAIDTIVVGTDLLPVTTPVTSTSTTTTTTTETTDTTTTDTTTSTDTSSTTTVTGTTTPTNPPDGFLGFLPIIAFGGVGVIVIAVIVIMLKRR